MLTEFLAMWDGHLGWMNVAENRMELKREKCKPVRLAPYYFGLKKRVVEMMEINKILVPKVIEPAQRPSWQHR